MSEATTLLIVRHGETEWNAAGRVQGQTNSDLTALGRAQAEAVAAWLDAEGGGPGAQMWGRPAALYSSDLDRAQQTAAPIGRVLGLAPTLEPELREMGFGELEGLSWDEVDARFPQVSLRLWGDDADHTARPPGGESRAEMHARSSACLEAIAARHPGATVAAVSHGGVIGFFFRGVVGVPLDLHPAFSTPNGAIAAFRYREGRFKLLTWGLVPPLAPR